jgi:hypothetical protein
MQQQQSAMQQAKVSHAAVSHAARPGMHAGRHACWHATSMVDYTEAPVTATLVPLGDGRMPRQLRDENNARRGCSHA